MKRILAIFLLCGAAFAGTCPANVPSGISTCKYFSVSGSDGNTGDDETHPWQYVPGMTSATHTTMSAGTGYVLKGGDVWTYTYFPYSQPTFSGSSTASYGCAGTGCVFIGVDPTWNHGTVNAVTLTRDLGGCTSAPTVSFSGGGGTGAAATATLMSSSAAHLSGFVLYVTVTNGGSGYTSNPTVTISGGGCTQVTAVADITRAIWDYGAGSRNWDASTYPNGPFHISQNNGYAVYDSIEARNESVVPSSNYDPQMFGSYNTKYVTFNNVYAHNLTETTQTSGQEEGIDQISLNMNGSGNADTGLIANSFVNNAEPTYLSNTTNCQQNTNDPCTYGSGGIWGGALLYGNKIYGTRWAYRQIPSGYTMNFHDNEIWLGLYSCCGAHANGIYILPASGTVLVTNNILHDVVPGMSNFYLQMGNGTTYYVANNVGWNLGISTDAVGIDVTNGGGVGGATVSVFNNTFVGSGGTGDCINNNAGTFSADLTVVVQNNHCITTGSLYSLVGSAVYQNFAGSTNSTNINASSLTQSTTTANGKGYLISNLWAPPSGGCSGCTVDFPGANLTSVCSTVTLLCSDLLGVARNSSGNWQAGAYQFVTSSNTGINFFGGVKFLGAVKLQ